MGQRGCVGKDSVKWGGDEEDSGLNGWGVWVSACVAGRPAVSGLGGV